MKNDELHEIDWQQACSRLEGARRAIEAGGELPPQEAERILRERAQALARPSGQVSFATAALEILVVSLGVERYGMETAHVVDVLRLPELTRVPCTPPFVKGVINYRGRVVPLLDLQGLLGREGSQAAAESRVVVVEAGGMRFGILATAVAGSIRIGADDLAPPPAGPGGGPSLVRGVTAEMVAVLDVDAMARDPRIVVDEDVG